MTPKWNITFLEQTRIQVLNKQGFTIAYTISQFLFCENVMSIVQGTGVMYRRMSHLWMCFEGCFLELQELRSSDSCGYPREPI